MQRVDYKPICGDCQGELTRAEILSGDELCGTCEKLRLERIPEKRRQAKEADLPRPGMTEEAKRPYRRRKTE